MDTPTTIEEDLASQSAELAGLLAVIAGLDPFDKRNRTTLHENFAESRILVDSITTLLQMTGAPE